MFNLLGSKGNVGINGNKGLDGQKGLFFDRS